MTRKLTDKQRAVLRRMLLYGCVALCIVGVELATFQLCLQLLGLPYRAAVVVSVAVAFILNWYGSRRLVFRSTSLNVQREFWLTLLVSCGGLLLQLLVTTICVEWLRLIPLHGKLIAIGITFGWNFWWREKWIFKQTPPHSHSL